MSTFSITTHFINVPTSNNTISCKTLVQYLKMDYSIKEESGKANKKNKRKTNSLTWLFLYDRPESFLSC